jgi:predicted acylesterase/phospholipase RssA
LRIVSIDGGGIRGIIAARILAAIEARAGTPIGSSAELIAGTSTGGLLALALALPGNHTSELGAGPPSAEALCEVYMRTGGEIFRRRQGTRALVAPIGGPRWGAADWVLKLRDRLGIDKADPGNARYSAEGLEAVLTRLLGECRMSESTPDVLVPSYDTSRSEPVIFRSRAARHSDTDDFRMSFVARASSAAPTFFPPVRLIADGIERVLVDGGLIANNPAMLALTDALTIGQPGTISLVSVGTGSPGVGVPRTFDQASTTPWPGVVRDLMSAQFDGASALTHGQILDAATQSGGRIHYIRLQAELGSVSPAMDDASPAHMTGLRAVADAFVRGHGRQIEEAARVLAA